MTLIEIINLCREDLAEESLGVRRSWEDMFRYTLRHYAEQTALSDFDPDDFSTRLLASKINPAIVDGYARRWREVLRQRGA